MFDWAFLAIALVGTTIAAWIDIKTTEIPDIIAVSMLVAGGVAHGAYAYMTGSLTLLIWALIIGGIFLGIGYLHFFTGQWGEADVFLLAVIGFLIPQPLSMFAASATAATGFVWPIVFLINMIIVAAFYSLAASIWIGIQNKRVVKGLLRDLRKNWQRVGAIYGALVGGLLAALLYLGMTVGVRLSSIALSFVPFAILAALLFLWWRFAKVIETNVFRARIPTSKLRPGDMLAEDIRGRGINIKARLAVGLTAAQINKIRRMKKYALIKRGLVYAPVFVITILATLFGGNLLLLLLGLG